MTHLIKKATFAIAALFLIVTATQPASAAAWRFGVMGDTQWVTDDPAGQNPNGVAVSIISQLNTEFIHHGVKLVIQVGDLTENGNDADIAARAAAAQPLINAGIGFFPLRGNHEIAAGPANDYGIEAVQTSFPQTRGLSNTFGAVNFSSPVSVSAELNGLSYSFDFSNARFVIIDNWVTPVRRVDVSGYHYGYSIGDQQPWISDRLDRQTRGTDHAFVFSHQNLIGEYHRDCVFSGYTYANPAMQNAFMACLQNNRAKYYISGHDHMHQRSIITSPDGSAQVQQLICASASNKFYTPKSQTDKRWIDPDSGVNQKSARKKPLSQEYYTVGYYIFTVDGPQVTVDYYSSTNSYPEAFIIAPEFTFVKKETWGYRLDGTDALTGTDTKIPVNISQCLNAPFKAMAYRR